MKKYSPQDLNLFKNGRRFSTDFRSHLAETDFNEVQLQKKLQVKKGASQMFLSREFMEAVKESLNITTALNLFNTIDVGILSVNSNLFQNDADKFLYPTLIGAQYLNLPGQFERNCLDDKLR